VTLRVHPRYGEELEVVSSWGRRAVAAEAEDGRRLLLPVEWTSLHPRAEPLEWEGRPVRLAPAALRSLAAWVGGRLGEADDEPAVGRRES